VLTDSTRAFDRPYCNAATIPARCAATALANATNAGMRQRLAHDSHASSSATPWPPLTRNTSRSSSFNRYARYNDRLISAIRASLARWRRVKSAGFFHSANLAPLSSLATAVSPPLRAAFQVSRRTTSRASVAHFTTWKGSRHSTACGQRRAATFAIQAAASALRWVSLRARSSPRVSKNRSRVCSSRPGAAHTSQPVS
jgi:hypothetical protein